MSHTLTDAERMLDRAYAPPSQIPVTDAAAAEKREEASAKRAEDAWSRDLDRRATLALCGTACGWALLAGLVAWAVTRLPGGWRDLGAVGVVCGIAWVVKRSLN